MEYIPIWLRDKYEEGLATGKAKWLSKGEAIGMAKGAEDEKLKMAKRMLADGLQVEIISKYTGLSLEEITKLKQARREH
jgi:predicted transposase/invertase (TIGR01784 family)